MPTTIPRPDPAEHAPFALTYVNAAAAAMAETGLRDIQSLLASQCDALEQLVAKLPDDKANLQYAPGKWTLKESLVHIADAERVFSYRAMRIARGDQTPLPGFEQDNYVPHSRANSRTLSDILAEIRAVRNASVALVQSFDDEAVNQSGTASNKPVTVRALCWLIAGHAAHHITITRDRYLPALM